MDDDEIRIRHMLDATREALSFIQGRTRKDLEDNRMLSLALIRLLEIIGEAANGVSSEYRNTHAEIPWKLIVGMRNRLIHGYFDVDLDIVWETITRDLPELQKQLEQIVETFEQ